MSIINVPKHAKPLVDELSSVLFDKSIQELSNNQLLGIALAAGYATKDTKVMEDLAKYGLEHLDVSTISLSKYAASLAELNSNCNEQDTSITDRNSGVAVQANDCDSSHESVSCLPGEAPPAANVKSSLGFPSIERDLASSQDWSQNQESAFDTNLFFLAATCITDRKVCLKIGSEWVATRLISRNTLMTIVRIAVLIESIAAQMEYVDETSHRVLLVDDDVRITRRLKLSLARNTNFVVKTENNSLKVLQVAREFSPDIIVLDLYMPGKNGGEVLGSLKADPELRDIKVVFLTSLLTKEEAGEHGKTISGNLYMAKPTEDRIIINIIRDQLTNPDLLAA